MKVALIGLLQSGKSMLVSALSGKEIPPIGSTNIAETIVPVPDERLDWLEPLYKGTHKVYATIDCLDVPGFSFVDEHGRLAARRLINQIRTVDMLVLVVRAFENAAVPGYRNSVNLKRDLAELKNEILLADLELVATRIERLEKQINKPTKMQGRDKAELVLQKKLQDAIEAEKPIGAVIETKEEMDLIRSFGFLTLKPMAVVINIDEKQLGQKSDFSVAIEKEVPVITLCAELERELGQLDAESRADFMADMGLNESAAKKFISGCYSALGLISFLTVGSDEVRAWPIKQGTKALNAAGKVHSDIKRGFIRAGTMSFSDLKELGNEKAVKAAGKVRLEGKEYIVQDGDVIEFRFNV